MASDRTRCFPIALDMIGLRDYIYDSHIRDYLKKASYDSQGSEYANAANRLVH